MAGPTGEDSQQQQYSEQSTLRIGESLPTSDQAPLSSQQGHRRRRHSGSIPDATTALSMMGGSGSGISSDAERLAYSTDGPSSITSSGGHHRHRSLSDSRSNNPRGVTRGKLRNSFKTKKMDYHVIVTPCGLHATT